MRRGAPWFVALTLLVGVALVCLLLDADDPQVEVADSPLLPTSLWSVGQAVADVRTQGPWWEEPGGLDMMLFRASKAYRALIGRVKSKSPSISSAKESARSLERLLASDVIVIADAHNQSFCRLLLDRHLALLQHRRGSGILCIEALAIELQGEVNDLVGGATTTVERWNALLHRSWPWPTRMLARILKRYSSDFVGWRVGCIGEFALTTDDLPPGSTPDALRQPLPVEPSTDPSEPKLHWDENENKPAADIVEQRSRRSEGEDRSRGPIVVLIGAAHTLGDEGSLCARLRARGLTVALVVTAVPELAEALPFKEWPDTESLVLELDTDVYWSWPPLPQSE